MNLKLFFLTALTMVAFAANSVFCRMALMDSANDPVSFTLVRLGSGAIALTFFYLKFHREEPFKLSKGNLLAPIMLFLYALFFSISYVQIGSGTGALILFASVQITMMLVAFLKGQKLSSQEVAGFVLAVSGFVYLLFPGLNTPPYLSTLFMALSGISWGIYSLLGQKSKNPFLSTARNFLFNLPLVIIVGAIFTVKLTNHGILCAVISGAITSGMGYILWYFVLKKIMISTAAIVQLSVPAIAAFGGVLFLKETIHIRLIIASLLIFGGILLKVRAKAAS